MKKRCIIAVGIAALSLCLSACQSDKEHHADTADPSHPILTDTEDESQNEKTPIADSGQSGPGQGALEQGSTDSSGGISHQDDDQERPDRTAEQDRIHVQVLEDLGLDGVLLSETFYKAGDRNQSLSLYISDGIVSNNHLSLYFHNSSLTDGDTAKTSRLAEIVTEPGKTTYNGIIESDPAYDTGSWEITFGRKGDTEDGLICISVKGEEPISGVYYPSSSYAYSDIFQRYLSKADLWFYPTEDLWLLRNEIYAAHGRIFNNEILSQYFSQKIWYRENIRPDNFSESVLSDVEKKNILLIQSLENDEDRNVIDGKMYGLEDFPIAPYLSYLTDDRETGVTLDLSDITDMGAYYVVHGKIHYPVTISQRELDIVENGGTTEVIVNDLTGETKVFQMNMRPEQSRYSRYLLCESDSAFEEMGRGSEVFIRPNYQTGLYELWQDSDDTIMKVVYEGDIYVMKGAVTGSYVSITEASRDQKEIILDGGNTFQVTPDAMEYHLSGNCLRHNGRGTITAIYYLGD